MLLRVFEPKTLDIKLTTNVLKHDVTVDYITNPLSNFEIDVSTVNINRGDIVMLLDDDYYRTEFDGSTQLVKSKPIYLGVVTSYDENNKITTSYIYNLFNCIVDDTKMNGESIINLMMSLNHDELLLPTIEFRTATAGDGYVKLPEDNKRFITANLVDLIIDCHKQTGAVLTFEIIQEVSEDSVISRKLVVDLFEPDEKPIRLRDNTDFMKNINVVFDAAPTKQTNKLTIVSRDFHNIEAQYYATIDGEITTVFSDLVATPVRNEIIEHNENNTYAQEAQDKIGGYKIETNITFDVDLKNPDLLNFNGSPDSAYSVFQIGTKFIFTISGKSYYSVLTGFKYSNNAHVITYMFGYQRQTLQNIFKELTK